MLNWVVFLLVIFVNHNICAKIYDCFMFFNELDVLDIRLHEMYDHVDKFVLVESVETFRGSSKPLYYEENRERFQKFSDKIIHVVVEDRINTINPWDREVFQRNQIMRGLKNCLPDDIILVSDVDEIVRGSSLSEIVYALYTEKKPAVMCEQTSCRFYLNVKDVVFPMHSTCATTFRYLNQTCPQKLRENRKIGDQFLYPLIANAGWHFTSIGGLQVQIKKLESFSHQEADIPENKTEEAIYQYMQRCCRKIPLDHTFPTYVLENQECFREKGYIYEGSFTHRKPQRYMNVFKSKRRRKQEL